MRYRSALLLSALSLLARSGLAQGPVTTMFTYQGELRQSGTPVGSNVDLRFRLYDSASGGTQVGPELQALGVAMAAGRFTMDLDFGAVFAGQGRWLEVDARLAGGGAYATLTPRQPLSASPNAVYSLNAGAAANASQLNGQSALFYQDAANLTGTVADARLSGNIATLSGNQTFTGQVTLSNAGNTVAGDGAGVTGLNGSNIATGTVADARLSANVAFTNAANAFGPFTNSFMGNVGIGTTNPEFPLNFGNSLGDKISLTGGVGPHYGLGIQPSLLQIHTSVPGDSIAFGYGSSGSFTEQMRIRGTGNVGIGTSVPSATLDVNGSTPSIRLNGTNNPKISVDSGGAAAFDVGVATGAGAFSTAALAGDVVIRNSRAGGRVLLLNGSGTPAVLIRNNNDVDFLGGISSFTGNVGIGTSTPTAPLAFASTVGDKINLFGGSGPHYGFGVQSGVLQVHSQNAASDVVFGYGTSSGFTENMRIKGNGNVGIGTATPGFPLNFGNTLGDKISLFGDTGASYGFGVQSNELQIHSWNSSSDVVFGYGSSGALTETMRIKGNGNVGIGTSVPGANRLYVQGNASVNGFLSKAGGSFLIDHPLDPENKFLYHSFVESPDMMNVYNGNVRTDAAGLATVTLPDYFEALNRDFRYQLTAMDESENDVIFVKVYRKIGVEAPRQFTIKSSVPGIEVSWQITGIRHDAVAEQNRIPNSVEKVGAERGRYLHPAAFGLPAERGIYGRADPVSDGPAVAGGGK